MNSAKIFRMLKSLRYIFHSIYFNFHYLPIKQAIRLPVLLYKPHLLCSKGMIILAPEDGIIKTGMIQLGYRNTSIYPNNGFMWENKGGTVVFRGSCNIGNDSYISIGEKGNIDFGRNFEGTAGVKIISVRGIKFGKEVSFGWEVICMDTNFHPLYDMNKKEFKRASGPIEIGDNNWFAAQCKILHSTITPKRCIFAMGTIVTHSCPKRPYCIMGGSPVRILKEGIMRIVGQDKECI